MQKRLLAIALVPMLSGCSLFGSLINPGNSNLPLELKVSTTLPTFSYLNPGSSDWQTVPTVALTGEVTLKDSYGSVINAGAMNVTGGVTVVKTKVGGQTLYATLRSNQTIAEGRSNITPGEGASEFNVILDAVLSRVVIVPVPATSVKAGANLSLEYWVFGPLYRVTGTKAYLPLPTVTGLGDLTGSDGQHLSIKINDNAQPGDQIKVSLIVNNNNPQTATGVISSVTLTVQ